MFKVLIMISFLTFAYAIPTNGKALYKERLEILDNVKVKRVFAMVNWPGRGIYTV